MPITHATPAATGAIGAEEWDADHVGGGGSAVTIADSDPGAIGAGAVWAQTNAPLSDFSTLWVRDASDTGWLRLTAPISGTVDPSAGAGLAAALGSLYIRQSGGVTGELWVKSSAGDDTGWEQVPKGANLLELAQVGGVLISGDRPYMSFASDTITISTGATGDIALNRYNGNVLLLNLPTADPAVADALWNDTGTLKVSAG